MNPSPYAPPTPIPTNVSAFDEVTGIGGLPQGRIVELYGKSLADVGHVQTAIEESTSASVITLSWAGWISRHGGDDISVEQLASSFLSHVERTAMRQQNDIIFVDSVPAIEDSLRGSGPHPGLTARLMSQCLRTVCGQTAKTETVVIFLNEKRPAPGVTFGSGEVTTGGNALKYYCTLRIEVKRIDGELWLKAVKNKLAPPFQMVKLERSDAD